MKAALCALLVAAAGTLSASASNICAKRIDLDFSRCPDQSGASYKPRFISSAKVQPSNEVYVAEPQGSSICVDDDEINGYVHLSALPSNVKGDNVQSVQLRFHKTGKNVAWLKSHYDDTTHQVGSTPYDKAPVLVRNVHFGSRRPLKSSRVLRGSDPSTKKIKSVRDVVKITYC